MRDLKEAYGATKARMKKSGGAAGFARRMGYRIPVAKAPVKKKRKKKRQVVTKIVYIKK